MLVYSIVGALFGIIACLLVAYCKHKELVSGRFAGTYALMLIGALSILFSVDWGYASFIEGEPQAAAIGFLIFGGLGIVLFLIGFRVANTKPKEKLEAAAE